MLIQITKRVAIASIALVVGSIIILGLSIHAASPQIIPIQGINTTSYTDRDLGKEINKANLDCTSEWCEIRVEEPGTISTPVYLSPNRILTFGAFNYTIAATINVNTNDEIRGQGIGKTILSRDPSFFAGKNSDKRSSPPGDFNNLQWAYMIAINSNKTNTYLHDLTIDGNTAAIGYYDIEGTVPNPTGKLFHYPKGTQSEIFIMDSSGVDVNNIKLQNMQRGGLAMIGVNNVTIRNSEFASNGWNGDHIVYSGVEPSKNIKIIDSYLHGGSHNAIFLSLADGVVIEGNTIDANRQNSYFTGNGGQLTLYPNVTHVLISNNTITNAGYVPDADLHKTSSHLFGYGIEVHASYVQIVNNTITGNAGWGIFIQDNRSFIGAGPSHDILIKNNTITGNGFAADGRQYLVQSDKVYNITWENNSIGQ